MFIFFDMAEDRNGGDKVKDVMKWTRASKAKYVSIGHEAKQLHSLSENVIIMIIKYIY